MKALLLFLFSFVALTANADSGPRISSWDERNSKEVTLSFANRDIRYIEESLVEAVITEAETHHALDAKSIQKIML